MGAIASQIIRLTIVYSIVTQSFIQAQIKENIKAPCHWPLSGRVYDFDHFYILQFIDHNLLSP